MGSSQEQLNELITRLEMDSTLSQSWLNLGNFYILNQLWGSLLELFELRSQLSQDGRELLLQLVFQEGRKDIKACLLNYVEKPTFTQGNLILNYASASVKIISGQIEQGCNIFKEIDLAISVNPELGKGLPHVQSLGWMADQFISLEEVGRLRSQENVKIMPPLEWVLPDNVDDNGPVIFAGCDIKYFNLFIDRFIEVFKGFGHIHVHVVKGDRKVLQDRLTQYEDISISFSCEPYEEEDSSPFYASVRFLRCDEIIQHFNRDLIMIDVDIEAVYRFDEFIEEGHKADVTLFREETIIPWMHLCAGLFYFKNNIKSLEYIITMKKAIMANLTGARWFIDQTILNCIDLYAIKNIDGIIINYLNQEKGFLHKEVVIQVKKDDIAKLRKNAGY